MKEWLSQEANRTGMKPQTIYMRLNRKPEFYYPTLKLRRVNQRVVFVQV